MKISVIITCYNEANYIRDCIISVFEQSEFEFIKEILVINDGSTDNTENILYDLSKKHRKLKIFNTQNNGLPSARNLGIKNSSGEYLAFLDADDYWLKDKIKDQLVLINNRKDINLIYTNYYDFTDDNIKLLELIKVKSLNNSKDQLVDYFIYDAPIVPSTIICKKEIFENIGLFNESIKTNDDTDMFLRILEKYKIFYLNSNMTCKRKRKNQITNRLDLLLDDQKKIANLAIKRNLKLDKYKSKRESFRLIKASIDCYFNHKEKKNALKYAYKSFLKNKYNIRVYLFFISIILPMSFSLNYYKKLKRIFYKFRN